MSRFQFVADNSSTYPVKRLCELVEVTRSSFYAWQAGAPARAERAAGDAALTERIRAVHDEDKTCGAPRITAELNDGAPAGERVNHKRVARVMRAAGIAGYVKKRKVRTTVPEPSDQQVPDLLKRDFTAQAPGQRYVGDLPAARRVGGWRQPLSGHRDRLLQPTPRGLTLDPGTHRVLRGTDRIKLTTREFELLQLLMAQAGRVVTRDNIIDVVWDGRRDLRSHAVDVYMASLRNKIDRPFGTDTITTLRGVGYRLEIVPT